jgi:hypothetical protein
MKTINQPSDCSNSECNKNIEVLTVAFCQLWRFIVTSIDIVLFKQQDEITEFKVKKSEMVE